MELGEFKDGSGFMGPGIYALVYVDEIVYIGKSKCLIQRVTAHRNAWNKRRKMKPGSVTRTAVKVVPFTKFLWRSCSLFEMDVLEIEYIKHHKPKYNEKHVPKRTFAEDGVDITELIGGKMGDIPRRKL